jgi:serine/threonine protein kinase
MASEILGQGAYGAVVARDGFAYKKFAKGEHIIQEFAAGSYLRNATNIVKVREANHKTLEMKMDLYNMNLRKYMEGRHKSKTKLKILKDILYGLCEIHKRGMVHGDIKPGNILVKINKDKTPTAFIGDLGFVSLAPYSKVRRTTAVYRDPEMRQHWSHDMYSMSVVMLELFGEVKVYEKLSCEELCKSADKSVKDKLVLECIKELSSDDYKKRPSAEMVLKKIYNEEFTTPVEKAPNYEHKLSTKVCDKIERWIRPLCRQYDIKRGARGLKALLMYIYNNESTKGHHKLHTAVMVMILSCLFGKSKFQEKEIMKWCKKEYSHHDVIRATANLLSDYDVVRLLMIE